MADVSSQRERYLEQLLRQVPALAVLTLLVYVFLAHETNREERTAAALRDNAAAMQRLAVAVEGLVVRMEK